MDFSTPRRISVGPLVLRKLSALSALLFLAATAAGCQKSTTVVVEDASRDGAANGKSVQNGDDGESVYSYPDFGYQPAFSDYPTGPVFHLSQQYPSRKPPDSEIPDCARGAINDVKDPAHWKDWMAKVKKYCFDGNVGATNIEDDWQVYKSDKWFNMPWQHWGPRGREAIHGLTQEAQVHPKQLAANQTTGGQTYAVAFYNRFGGYAIGRVWPTRTLDENKRDIGPNRIKDFSFPVGTVVCKLLFTDTPIAEVPFLSPPVQWNAYIAETFTSTKRKVTKVSLIQMDIMVRHENAPLKWILGTFQYNGSSKNADPKNPWDRLVPVGIQWKNDPTIKVDNPVDPPKTEVGDKTWINPKLSGSLINSDTSELPATHLGWGGRLNGPVDNGTSSCISCHMTAQMPQEIPLFPGMLKPQPPQNSDEWMLWFRDLKPGDKFVPQDGKEHPELGQDLYTADFSLQMAEAFQNWYQWRNEARDLKAKAFEQKREAKERVGIKQEFIVPGTDQITPSRNAGP